MSSIVAGWKLHISSPRYDGLDTVTIDGENFKLIGESEMPVIEVKLAARQFRSIIRTIKRVHIDRVSVLFAATRQTLERLGVDPDKTKAATRIPRGSDDWNMRNVLDWLDKITPSNEAAIKQLVAIDATANKRLTGE